MPSTPYLTVREALARIEEPNRTACVRLLAQHDGAMRSAAGASHNHQVWEGGYLDHIAETMNLAVVLFPILDALRPLPFSLSDALLVLFLHDLEKPWRQGFGSPGLASGFDLDLAQQRHEFRLALAEQSGFVLDESHVNAVDFVEGEGPRYSPDKRLMRPLAAFCHVCDTLSARLWFDHPSMADSWGHRSLAASANRVRRRELPLPRDP
jgi:hypothetical protein